ncbi:AGE family epimerase/isomerase [Roseibium aquae]|uniref:AGE family epimerase/isomerase n=1 Tax=Roseibium aquae TaxID=1323746 RepID=A0A916TMM4_9HYPH|nr:AGE family epimerase/isomerase [Roseibium aquae]GGB49467.1 AGE family epimerase/isomerase [Roseibium aquae]
MTPDQAPDLEARFQQDISNLIGWLRRDALPLWSKAGRNADHGGYVERLDQGGRPSLNDPVRSRVPLRQLYCMAKAGTRGFLGSGDWAAACLADLAWFERVFRRKDGFFGNLASSDAVLIDPSFDLYNQAFALFGYAAAARAIESARGELEHRALGLLHALIQDYKHKVAGFEETVPPSAPLRSNPHMHMLEACLAWEEISDTPDVWVRLADDIVAMAFDRLIDPETGALHEFFDRQWVRLTGEMCAVEPGHQFEWAWLIWHWATRRDQRAAHNVASRLFQIGRQNGVCPIRKVAVMRLNGDLSIADPVARLWPQTEWLKAACTLARTSHGEERQAYLAEARAACHALRLFLETDTPGLWFDKMMPDGSFIAEPAPASSFYHIVCAIFEAADTAGQLERRLHGSAA